MSLSTMHKVWLLSTQVTFVNSICLASKQIHPIKLYFFTVILMLLLIRTKKSYILKVLSLLAKVIPYTKSCSTKACNIFTW